MELREIQRMRAQGEVVPKALMAEDEHVVEIVGWNGQRMRFTKSNGLQTCWDAEMNSLAATVAVL